MRDQRDIPGEDDDSLGEVELATRLITAATAFDGPMSRESIDRILGVHPDSTSTDQGG